MFVPAGGVERWSDACGLRCFGALPGRANVRALHAESLADGGDTGFVRITAHTTGKNSRHMPVTAKTTSFAGFQPVEALFLKNSSTQPHMALLLMEILPETPENNGDLRS